MKFISLISVSNKKHNETLNILDTDIVELKDKAS